nr:hypothetical protein [Tanacetum cinerariifolium]
MESDQRFDLIEDWLYIQKLIRSPPERDVRSHVLRLLKNMELTMRDCLMQEDTELTKVGRSSADEPVIDSNDMDFRKGLHKHARRNRAVNRVSDTRLIIAWNSMVP